MNEEIEESQDFTISEEKIADIRKECETLKKTKKLVKVFPIAVIGDAYDEKDFYVAYFKEPSFKDFSKFSALSRSNEVQAFRQLSKDCFIGGDKELVDDDSLFISGTLQQITEIIRTRKSKIINL